MGSLFRKPPHIGDSNFKRSSKNERTMSKKLVIGGDFDYSTPEQVTSGDSHTPDPPG
jgi:hypothetical protein